MKIETNQPQVFRPVTITLETPQEVAMLAALIGYYTNPSLDAAFGLPPNTSYRAYEALAPVALAYVGADFCEPLRAKSK